MSRVRWSDASDLYVYDDVAGGITTHVANFRRASFADETVPIGGPFDGRSFNDQTERKFKKRLKALRAAGYQFPDGLARKPFLVRALNKTHDAR